MTPPGHYTLLYLLTLANTEHGHEVRETHQE